MIYKIDFKQAFSEFIIKGVSAELIPGRKGFCIQLLKNGYYTYIGLN